MVLSTKLAQARRALILNHANWEGISRLPYLLRKAGFAVEVMAPPDNFIAHSNWCSNFVPAPADLPAMLSLLKQRWFNGELNHDWVIVGDDPLLCALAKLRGEPWAAALLPCPADVANTDFLVSKASFITQAQAAGIAVPASQVCNSHAELVRAVEYLGWPLVVKQPEGFGGKAVAIAHNWEELAHTDFGMGQVVAQAFVAGATGSAVALYNHGKLVCFYSYLRHRTWGPRGVSTAVKFKTYPQLLGVLGKLGQLSGYHGLCGVDFIEDPHTGQPLVLEQNFRPTLTVLLGQRVGVDLVEVLRNFPMSPDGPSKVRTQQPHAGEVALFPGDLIRALDERDLRGALRWLVSPHWWRELNWHDGRLLRHNLRYVGRFGVQKLKKWTRWRQV